MGSGLALKISNQFAHLSSGKLIVEKSPLRGCRVKILLPIHTEKEHESHELDSTM